MTRDQVRNSPPLASESAPRSYETDYATYYGYPQYWLGRACGGSGPIR